MFLIVSLAMVFVMSGLLSLTPMLTYSLVMASSLCSGLMSINISWVAMFNTMLFCLTVLFIGAVVMSYSEAYMESDKYLTRFIMLVLLFVSSMLILIFSSSWLTIILGWDGLGLSSYFLVVFYLNPASNSGGLITVLSNRVGDIFIVMFIIFSLNMMSEGGTPNSGLLVVSVLIFLAAITKSAMFPFMSWLPEAMAAPTPVSSLVHSSTLVTAGVFLLLQMSLWMSALSLTVLMGLSVVSLVVSSLVAMLSMDNKKVVALSTLSQLSLMMLSLALGLPALAFFHLIGHAMFKSCLFLSVGAVMHMTSGSQEARTSGSVKQWASVSVMGVSLLSLSAAPFTTAYYTKESILLMSLSLSAPKIIVSLLIMSAMFTMMYSARFLIAALLTPKMVSANLPDSASMHLFTAGLIMLSAMLGMSMTSSTVAPYSMSASLLALVLGFIFSSLILASLGGVNLSVHFIHLSAALKQMFSSVTPKVVVSPIMMNMVSWEMGALSKLVAGAWTSVANTTSGAAIMVGRALFSSYLSAPLIVILIIMIAY